MGAVHTTAGGFTTYHPPGLRVRGLCALLPAGGRAVLPRGLLLRLRCGRCCGRRRRPGGGRGGGRGDGESAAIPAYPLGASFATLPTGAVYVDRAGVTYYQVGTSWFRPSYGANGVYYSVVPAP